MTATKMGLSPRFKLKSRPLLALVVLMLCAVASFAGNFLFYKMLGVEKTATRKDIKRAFRKMALKLHPDKATDKEEAQRLFVELVLAFETLEDPAKRRDYDNNPHAFHRAPAPQGQDQSQSQGSAGTSPSPSAEETQQQYDEAQAKYNKFFQNLQRSFNDYIRRQEANNWDEPASKQDSGFEFDFNDLWDDLGDEELDEFNSLYKEHLKTHYTAHEKAVREVWMQFLDTSHPCASGVL